MSEQEANSVVACWCYLDCCWTCDGITCRNNLIGLSKTLICLIIYSFVGKRKVIFTCIIYAYIKAAANRLKQRDPILSPYRDPVRVVDHATCAQICLS